MPKGPSTTRSGAPLPLLVPCFLAHTRPLLCPRRSMRPSTSEPAVFPYTNQRHRPSYTVSPAGQRFKHSRPAVGAAQAVGRHKKAPPGSR